MKIRVANLILRELRAEYPSILVDTPALEDLVNAIVHQHLLMNRFTRRQIEESREVPEAALARELTHR